MKVDTVTRDNLRMIEPGQSVVYELPTHEKVRSVRSMASFLGAKEGMTFKVNAKSETTVEVTRV